MPFNYVVARPWEPGDPDSTLSIYAYGSEVHQAATMDDALKMLAYVKGRVRGEKGEDPKHYAIYEVTFTKKETQS